MKIELLGCFGGLLVLAIVFSKIGIISVDTFFIMITIMVSALYLNSKTTKSND